MSSDCPQRSGYDRIAPVNVRNTRVRRPQVDTYDHRFPAPEFQFHNPSTGRFHGLSPTLSASRLLELRPPAPRRQRLRRLLAAEPQLQR